MRASPDSHQEVAEFARPDCTALALIVACVAFTDASMIAVALSVVIVVFITSRLYPTHALGHLQVSVSIHSLPPNLRNCAAGVLREV